MHEFKNNRYELARRYRRNRERYELHKPDNYQKTNEASEPDDFEFMMAV